MTLCMHAPKTLLAAAADLRRGATSPSQLLDVCLQRIARHESQVSAWVFMDVEGARKAAERATRELTSGLDRGPLHGIPIGIKDIVDVAGLPTRAGSPLTDEAPATADAEVVSRLRDAGAVILGKTVTTEFACFSPPPTRNPWNAAHTPGGSSSGSAAALAVGMCYGAIGSQTGGSITRPASYCGVAGCKPTFGRLSRAGVVPMSFHLDHVGPMARTAADCAAMYSALTKTATRSLSAPPRLGLIEDFFLTVCDSEVAALTRQAIERLRAAGATIEPLALPTGFDQVIVMHRRVMVAECAEFHRRRFGAPCAGYSANMAGVITEGLAVTMSEYQEALAHRLEFSVAFDRALSTVDALIMPATPAAAPGCETTGDPRFNSPFSHAGIPTVSFPFALTAAGLPLALQLAGPKDSEPRLFGVATWCEERLPFTALPPKMQ